MRRGPPPQRRDPADTRRLISSLVDLTGQMERVEVDGSSNEKPLRSFQLELYAASETFPRPIPAQGGVLKSFDQALRRHSLNPGDPYGIGHWQASQLESDVDAAVRDSDLGDDDASAIGLMETSKQVTMEDDSRRRRELREQVRRHQFFKKALSVDTSVGAQGSLYSVLAAASGNARALQESDRRHRRRQGASPRRQRQRRLPKIDGKRAVRDAVRAAREAAHRRAVLEACVPVDERSPLSLSPAAAPVHSPLKPSTPTPPHPSLDDAFDGVREVLDLPQPSARDRSVAGPRPPSSEYEYIQDRRPDSRLRRALESGGSVGSLGSAASAASSVGSAAVVEGEASVELFRGSTASTGVAEDDDDDDDESLPSHISSPRSDAFEEHDPSTLYDSLRYQLSPDPLSKALRPETPYYKRKLAEQRRIKKWQDQCRWHPSDKRRPRHKAVEAEEETDPLQLTIQAGSRAADPSVPAAEERSLRATAKLSVALARLGSRRAERDAEVERTFADAQELLPNSFVLSKGANLLELRLERRRLAVQTLADNMRHRNARFALNSWRAYCLWDRNTEHDRGATVLQRVWRGKMGRRKARARAKHNAAVERRHARMLNNVVEHRCAKARDIQCLWRGHVGRCRAVEARRRLDAALLIQTHVRRLNSLAGAIQLRLEKFRREKAAVAIQRRWRGVRGRRRFAAKKREALVLEREGFFLNRGAVFVYNFELNGAAVVLQYWWRNLAWRVHVRRSAAAAKIQRAWRAFALVLDRRRVAAEVEREIAVRTLQRIYRGHRARDESRTAKAARERLEELERFQREMEHRQRVDVKIATFLRLPPPKLEVPPAPAPAALYLVRPEGLVKETAEAKAAREQAEAEAAAQAAAEEAAKAEAEAAAAAQAAAEAKAKADAEAQAAAGYDPDADWNPVRRRQFRREQAARRAAEERERLAKGLARPPPVGRAAALFRRGAVRVEREWAAKMIQCAYRRLLAKRELLRRRRRHRRRAVVKIQALWRAALAREFVRRSRAAIGIQRVARGRQGRLYAVLRRADLTWAARLVQAKYRWDVRNRGVRPLQRWARSMAARTAGRRALRRHRRLREQHVAGAAEFKVSKARELHRNVLNITYGGLDEDGDLQRLFRHFCSFGSRDNTTRLEGSKFVKFLQDGELLNKELNQRRVELIFMQTKEHKERHLTYEQFLLALEEVARVRFPGTERFGTYDGLEAKMLQLLLRHSLVSKTSKRFRRSLKDNSVYKFTDLRIMWARNLIKATWRLHSHWGLCPKLVFDALAAERQRLLERRSATLVQAAWRRNRAGRHMVNILKDNYKKFIDDATGYPFWVNTRTGATMWRKPLVFGTADLDEALFYPEEDKKFVLQCANGCGQLARHFCDECRDAFCAVCVDEIHRKGKKAGHTWVGVDLCIECDFQVATKDCQQCGDRYCDNCYPHRHRSGKMLEHDWTALMPMCHSCGQTAAHVRCDPCNMSYCRACAQAEHAVMGAQHHATHDQPFDSSNLQAMYAEREEERQRLLEEQRLKDLAKQASDRKVYWAATVFAKHWRGRMGRREAYAKYRERKQFKLQQVLDNKIRAGRLYKLRKAVRMAPKLPTDPTKPLVVAPEIMPIVMGHLRARALKRMGKYADHPVAVRVGRVARRVLRIKAAPPKEVPSDSDSGGEGEGEGEGEGGEGDGEGRGEGEDEEGPNEQEELDRRGETWLPGTVTATKHHKLLLTSEDLTEWVTHGDRVRVGDHKFVIPLNGEITEEAIPISLAWEDDTVAGLSIYKLPPRHGWRGSQGVLVGAAKFLRRQKQAAKRRGRMYLHAQAVYAASNYNKDEFGAKAFGAVAKKLRRASYAYDPFAAKLPGLSRPLMGLSQVDLARKAAEGAMQKHAVEEERAARAQAEAEAAEEAAAGAYYDPSASAYDDGSGGYYDSGYDDGSGGYSGYDDGSGGYAEGSYDDGSYEDGSYDDGSGGYYDDGSGGYEDGNWEQQEDGSWYNHDTGETTW